MKWLALLILAALAAGIVYLHKTGLSDSWRNRVTAEFRKHGIAVQIGWLTVDPFRGVVARNVRILEKPGSKITLAKVDQIVLDINYSELLQNLLFSQKPDSPMFLQGVSLHNATLRIPTDFSDPKSERIKITHFSARVRMPPHVFQLIHARAELYGIQIAASGMFINPEAFHPVVHPSKNRAVRSRWAETILHELRQLKYDAAAPKVSLQFSGNLAAPSSIYAALTVSGRSIRRQHYRLNQLHAALTFANREVTLKTLIAADAHGQINAFGVYHFANREADFAVRSTLDIPAFLHAWNLKNRLNSFGEITFDSPPEISLSGHATLSAPASAQITGSVATGKFSLKKIAFDSASAEFFWNDSRWYVRDFKLENQTGGITVSAMQIPGDFRATLTSTINPSVFLPLLPPRVKKAFVEWKFIDPPQITISAHGLKPTLDDLVADGKIKLGRTVMRGSPLQSATAGMHYAKRAVTYSHFKIVRKEGIGTGDFTFDFGKHEIRLDHIHTTLNPQQVAVWITSDIAHDVAPYHFVKRPTLSINGVVQFDGRKNSRLTIRVSAPSGMNYGFLKKTLPFSSVSGTLLFTDRRLRISNLNATLFGGKVHGTADISFSKKHPHHTAFISADGVDFASLTKLYFHYKDSHGALSGWYRFSGRGGDARTMTGKGAIALVNGNVFAIPIFGPLSGVLNSIVPGLGYNVAHKATASFAIDKGVLSTDDFTVEGHGFSMIGGGKLFFLDNKMDFNIRINAQGLPGVLLFPVSKLFEYSARGSLSKPEWYPKILQNL